MKVIEKDFIELTRRAIIQNHSDDGFFVRTDWEGVKDLAIQNSLLGVDFEVAAAQESIPEELKKTWDRYRFSIFVRQKGHFRGLTKLLDLFSEAGISYAVFKGPVVAACYPNSGYRPSSDTDILIQEKDFDAADKIIFDMGYVLADEIKQKQHVHVFNNEKTGHTIELHSSVFEDYQGEKIRLLEEAGIMSFDSHIKEMVDGYEMWTLNHNEHLLYLFFHMIKHFMLEGGSVKFFTDITLFINRYSEKLDFDYFWKWMEKLGYMDFCLNFLTICRDTFFMQPDILQGRSCKAGPEVLERLLIDFMYNGDEEKLRESSWQLTGTFEPYFVGDRTSVKKSKAGRTLKYLFPMPAELNENYEYAKKCPVLLPVAWVHRVIRKLFWQARERDGEYSAVQKVELVESRLGLMASVGLLEED